MIKEQREKAAHILVLDAGDALIRDRAPATRTEGKSSVELMNIMGYDAMALGEGDLSMLGVSVIQQRVQEADFAVLSANVLLTGTEELLVEPYILRQMAGHRIAIIGVTGKAILPEVEIRDPVESLREIVDQVREQADILILLSHAGMDVNGQIAKQIQEIDLIISGGAQGSARSPLFTDGGPPVVHADSSSIGHAGRQIGVGTWSFDGQGQLGGQEWRAVALVPTVIDDPDMLAWVLANP